jgi:hypothetical protein
VVRVGVAEEDGGDVEGGVLAYGEVCWEEVRSVDVELGEEVEIHEVVDASGVSALQELFVELAVLAKVLPEIQKDALALLLDEDLVPGRFLCSVVNGDGCPLAPLSLDLSTNNYAPKTI